MSTTTAFLKLIQGALGEFRNGWNTVLNGNFELIDDHLADLRRALITGSSGSPIEDSVYATLVGTKFNLAARLAVSINADGSLNLSSSPQVASLATSEVNGVFLDGGSNPSPRNRFDDLDFEIWNARSAQLTARFTVPGTSRGRLDDGLAMRSRDAGQDSGHPISSPDRPYTSGLVRGTDAFLVGVAPAQVKYDATLGSPNTWPVFNIDGYEFRMREAITLNLATDSAGTVLVAGDIVYLFVERIGTSYGNANSPWKLSSSGSAPAAGDLRIVQNGTDGVISGQTFASAGASFQGSSTKRTVQVGDLLVIDSGPAAGKYIIATVPSQTQATIAGAFKADALSGVTWHVEDDAHPNIGAIKVADANTDPPFVAGRVYVGRGQLDAGNVRPVGGSPNTKIAFPISGVYDSGWVVVTTGSFPYVFEHNLGCLPSKVDLFVRDSSSGESFEPTRLQTVLVDNTDDTKSAKLRMMSMYHHSTRQRTQVHLSFQAPNATAQLFTKDDDVTVVTSGHVRMVARR